MVAREACGEGLFRLCARRRGSGARLLARRSRAAGPGGVRHPRLAGAVEAPAESGGVALRIPIEPVQQHFYGLGEGGQQFDRLGATRRLWNNQGNHGQAGADIAIPLLLSSAGYALYFDNSSAGEIVAGSSIGGAWIEVRFATGPLELYLIEGGGPCARCWTGWRGCSAGRRCRRAGRSGSCSPLGISTDTEDLLARAAHAPREAAALRRTDPAVHLRRRQGLEPRRRPPRVAARPGARSGGAGRGAAGRGFRLFSHEYPALHADSPLRRRGGGEGLAAGLGLSRRAPAAVRRGRLSRGPALCRFLAIRRSRRLVVARRIADLLAQGIDGLVARRRRRPAGRRRAGRGRRQATCTTASTCCASRPSPRARRADAPDAPRLPALPLRRPGHAALRRRGVVGRHRHAAFATLEMQVPIGLNLGLSGVPLWGTDIGGFYPAGPARSRALFALVRLRRLLPGVPRPRPSTGATTCPGRTARRSRRSAAASSSCATG